MSAQVGGGEDLWVLLWRPRASTLEFKGGWIKSILWHFADLTVMLSLPGSPDSRETLLDSSTPLILPSMILQILALLPYGFCPMSCLYFDY